MTRRSWRSTRSLSVLGSGRALPGETIGNPELDRRVLALAPGLSASSLRAVHRAMGVEQRHLCRDFAAARERPRLGARNPELAAMAVRAALADAGLAAHDIAYLITHTATPAQPIPPNAGEIADLLGYDGPFVELRQACTGFANALMIAQGLLAEAGAGPVVIVGSETGSVYFDPRLAVDDAQQRVNFAQMGDGAGAVVLGPREPGRPCIEASWFGCIGQGKTPGLKLPQGGSDHPFADGVIQFEQDFSSIATSGQELFEAGIAAAIEAGCPIDQADWIVPHQASGRIGEQIALVTGIAPHRFFLNADRVGNTGSAAIWIAFDELRRSRLSRGEQVVVLGAEATKYMFGGFAYRHG